MAQRNRQTGGLVITLLKLALFTMLVPCTVTLWLPYSLYSSSINFRSFESSGWSLAGILLLVLGTMGYLWCALDFAVAGRGTPAPIDPPKALVARGLYRFVRNPMYLSVLLVLLGESLLYGSWLLLRYAVVVAVIFHLVVVLYEEPALRRKFGESYEEYRRAVPRWAPRIPRTS